MGKQKPSSDTKYEPAPFKWKAPCTSTECTYHQISPYIGKLKSRIASDLIEKYTKPGDLIIDPFSGSGTIPLEAAISGREAFCSDVSIYAKILTVAKTSPPSSLEEALSLARKTLLEAKKLPPPDLRSIPSWVRAFFHPETLRESLNFATVCGKPGREFLMGCFLGILHHQRPGFLSFPSSHLVPYLRSKNFPKEQHPSLYEYRALEPRLLAKIQRVFKRPLKIMSHTTVRLGNIEHVTFPDAFDAIITSPPYMNALDYGRDNRLRLWFISPHIPSSFDTKFTKHRKSYEAAIKKLALQAEAGLKKRGHCILIVGQAIKRNSEAHPAQTAADILKEYAPSLKLITEITDTIPDIRRARRSYRGVKKEQILIFRK